MATGQAGGGDGGGGGGGGAGAGGSGHTAQQQRILAFVNATPRKAGAGAGGSGAEGYYVMTPGGTLNATGSGTSGTPAPLSSSLASTGGFGSRARGARGGGKPGEEEEEEEGEQGDERLMHEAEVGGFSPTAGGRRFLVQRLFGGAMACSMPSGFVDASTLREVPDNQEVFVHVHRRWSVIVEIVEYQHSQAQARQAARYFWEDLAECNGAVAQSIQQIAVFSDSELTAKLSVEADKSVLVGTQTMPGALDNAGGAGHTQQQSTSAAAAAAAAVTVTGGGGGAESATSTSTWSNADSPANATEQVGAVEQQRHTVSVFLANIRLPTVDSDILITLHVPDHHLTADVTDHMRADLLAPSTPSAAPAGALAALSDDPLDGLTPLQLLRELLISFEVRDWSLFA